MSNSPPVKSITLLEMAGKVMLSVLARIRQFALITQPPPVLWMKKGYITFNFLHEDITMHVIFDVKFLLATKSISFYRKISIIFALFLSYLTKGGGGRETTPN